MRNIVISGEHYTAIMNALDDAGIRAALDNKKGVQKACLLARAAVKMAIMQRWPDRMGTIDCQWTREDLTDMETALLHYVSSRGNASHISVSMSVTLDRLRRLVERVRATIKAANK